MSTTVAEGAATAISGNQSVSVDVVTQTFSDGTKKSSADTSDLHTFVQDGLRQDALGISEADVEHWVNFGEGSSPEGPRAGEAGVKNPSQSAYAGPGTLPNPQCLSMDLGDESPSTIHLRTCTQYVEGRRANAKLFFKAKNTATGRADDGSCTFNCDKLTGFDVSSYYDAGQVVGWSPVGDEEVGNCTEKTTTTEAKGVSVSESNTVCPDRWGVYDLRNRASGSFWRGDAVSASRGGLHVQVVQLDLSSGANFNVAANLYWT